MTPGLTTHTVPPPRPRSSSPAPVAPPAPGRIVSGVLTPSALTAAAEAVERLNRMLTNEPTALSALMQHRVPCVERPGDDSPAFVRTDNTLGLLGVINGMFPALPRGGGQVVAVFDDDGKLLRFEVRT